MDRSGLSRLIPALCLGAGACVDGPPADGLARTEFDTAGATVFVRNAGSPATWQLRERLVLGSAGGAGEPRPDEFGRIVGVVADAAGRLYIADGQGADIRV